MAIWTQAQAGQAVTLTLADDIDIVRGDMIASVDHPPTIATSIDATLVWLNETPAQLDKRYRHQAHHAPGLGDTGTH